MTDDQWDALTPKQKQAQLAKMRADQRKHEALINKALSGMAAFVRAEPHALIEMMGAADSTPGLPAKYSMNIVVYGERYAEWLKARAAK